MGLTKQTSGELKTRVNSCLNKLSDRDTVSMAANELESIAKALPNDAFAPFLNCLSATDSSEKSPVRRHCVRLLSVMSAAHGDALSPHLARMISAVLRRLRDPDSAVRAACVDAISSISAHVSSPPFAAILKPLVDALFHEQDANAQIGASMSLSAAVDAAPEPDAAELRRILPRVLKLVRSDCSKAKPALLSFVGSIVRAGCVRSKGLLNSVVSTAIEFLSSEDWAARKAAAEVLEKVAVAERNLAPEFKGPCVDALESRRFDKVKLVREKMNRALEMWKDLPGISEDMPSPKDSSGGGQSPVRFSKSPVNIGLETPRPRKMALTRSPPSGCSSMISSQKSIVEHEDIKQCISSASKSNFKKSYRARVVPFNCHENPATADEYAGKDEFENQKTEFGDVTLIRKQLLQIENQQSNLLDLLQKGMSSLEKRVDGLEKVLDEMSQDFAISTRRISVTDNNTCCMLPGTEFLSPKFWRKAEGHNTVNSKFCSPFRNQAALHGGTAPRDVNAEISKLDGSPRN
ncbi:microtubule-associated protein tortifolia1 [Phtheirospermum japonicum]|uniref:Microtubule-associated protein tortifolia1 n=1 Tax=Phtheirospermum japonicum TaxID=374723 RepID=A0A830C339_9LAMI|nr:microtubule-associated protein tortifolia1 [Phtheirospermum japonicum]